MLNPDLRRAYPQAVSAQGSCITDASGRHYLDAASGAIASTLGHGHPTILAAARHQLDTLQFAYRTQFANGPSVQLAERLCGKLGYASAFFVNSGSEAVEVACRMAQQYWRERGRASKTRLLSRRLGYHGATLATLSLSGHWPRRRASGDVLVGEPEVATAFCARCPLGLTPDSCGFACAHDLEAAILRHGADSVAAFVVEPIVGAAGAAIVPPAGYLEEVRRICDRHGVLLIFDEVLTALGRTGAWLAADHWGVKGDIVCLGKGLNAGYFPMSAVLAAAHVHDAIESGSAAFQLGHTHSNHPVGAAIANAVLDVLETDALIPRVAEAGPWIGETLAEATAGIDAVGAIRGRGMFWGIELVSDAGGTPFDPRLRAADRAVQHAFDRQLLIYPATGFADGTAGDAVIFAPPLNTSASDLALMVRRLRAALIDTDHQLSSNKGDIRCSA
jgi:adenosylmethionine-8-amino-7-oxononanoate aminotransferase